MRPGDPETRRPGDPEEEAEDQAEFRAARHMAEFVFTAEDDVHPMLRDAVERRDREQLLDDDARLKELTERIPSTRCFVCDGHVIDSSDETGLAPLRVCGGCGGRKKQMALERGGFGELLQRHAFRKGPTGAETPGAGPGPPLAAPQPEEDPPGWEDLEHENTVPMPDQQEAPPAEETPMSAPKTCPHCGKKLRSHNTRGICSKCWLTHGRHGKAAATAKAGEAVRSTDRVTTPADIETRFNVVVDVLGLDRDEVLRDLMESWLSNLKATIKPRMGEP